MKKIRIFLNLLLPKRITIILQTYFPGYIFEPNIINIIYFRIKKSRFCTIVDILQGDMDLKAPRLIAIVQHAIHSIYGSWILRLLVIVSYSFSLIFYLKNFEIIKKLK